MPWLSLCMVLCVLAVYAYGLKIGMEHPRDAYTVRVALTGLLTTLLVLAGMLWWAAWQ